MIGDWKLITNTKEVRGACLLFDPAEDRIYIGSFEDWYEPEWADQDGNTLHIVPTHWMTLPAPPITNPDSAPPPTPE